MARKARKGEAGEKAEVGVWDEEISGEAMEVREVSPLETRYEELVCCVRVLLRQLEAEGRRGREYINVRRIKELIS